MVNWVRKLAALILLLTLPLQSLSAVFVLIHCLSDNQHEDKTVYTQKQLQLELHESAKNSHTFQHSGNSNIDDFSGSTNGHLCCNHVYTGVPSVAVLTAPETSFFAVTEVADTLPLFVPDRLLRPPRT